MWVQCYHSTKLHCYSRASALNSFSSGVWGLGDDTSLTRAWLLYFFDFSPNNKPRTSEQGEFCPRSVLSQVTGKKTNASGFIVTIPRLSSLLQRRAFLTQQVILSQWLNTISHVYPPSVASASEWCLLLSACLPSTVSVRSLTSC